MIVGAMTMCTNVILLVCCVLLLVPVSNGLTSVRKSEVNPPNNLDRRFFLVSSCGALIFPAVAQAATPPADYRSVDVGGGFDLMTEGRMKQKDALFPISMEGIWVCDRVVTLVEGDAFQAQSAWTGLGGTGPLKPNHSESYQTRFLRSPSFGDSGVVIDRAFDIAARANTSKDGVAWNVETPDRLRYGNTKLKVVQRSAELPSDKGFGFDELIAIDDGLFVRAAQIKRRYRRGFDEQGARIVEGLEIMKTFRVLDGIAGTELPTSVTKSRLTLRRPPS